MTVSAVVAAGTSVLLQLVVIRVLRKRAILDMPTERSSHTTPTPRGGGIAVVLAVAVGVLVAFPLHPTLVILGGIVACAVLGLFEDVRGIPLRTRLVAQALVGVLVVVLLWPPSGPAGMGIAQGIVGGVVCAIGYVAVVNAVNFMDGINGISTAQAVVGGLAYALLGIAVAEASLVIVGVVMAAAMIAFAPFNVPRAHVFLGDSGSYGLGAALAGMTIVAFNLGLPIEAALGPLAVYLADTGTTIVRRVAAGQAWRQPHRSHVYQRLTTFGFSHGQVSAVVGVLVAMTSGLGALSLTGDVPSRVAADIALFALLAAYLLSPRLLCRRRAALR